MERSINVIPGKEYDARIKQLGACAQFLCIGDGKLELIGLLDNSTGALYLPDYSVNWYITKRLKKAAKRG